MANLEKPSIAFTLSLVGGILIFVGSAVSLVWSNVGASPFGDSGFLGMMGSYHGIMGNSVLTTITSWASLYLVSYAGQSS
jgi:hypothetical protein